MSDEIERLKAAGMYRDDGGPTYLERHGHVPDEPCSIFCPGNPVKPGGSGGVTWTASPRKVLLHSLRERCEEDDGPRRCCGTAQLGPHRGDCAFTPAMQDAMLDHERMYWHETEVGDVVVWLTDNGPGTPLTQPPR